MHNAGIHTGTSGSAFARLTAVLFCALLWLCPATAQALDITVTNNAAGGAGSLAQAISDVNASSDVANNIYFASALSGQTITLGGGLTLTNNVSIQNNDATSGVTIYQFNGVLPLTVSGGAILSLGGASPLILKFKTNNAGINAIYSPGTLNIGSIGPNVKVSADTFPLTYATVSGLSSGGGSP